MLKKLAILVLPAILCGCVTQHDTLTLDQKILSGCDTLTLDQNDVRHADDEKIFPVDVCLLHVPNNPLVFRSMTKTYELNTDVWEEILRQELSSRFKSVRVINEHGARTGCDIIATPTDITKLFPASHLSDPGQSRQLLRQRLHEHELLKAPRKALLQPSKRREPLFP